MTAAIERFPFSPAQFHEMGRIFASFDIDPFKPDFSGMSESMIREMFVELSRFIAPEQFDEMMGHDPRYVGLFKPVRAN